MKKVLISICVFAAVVALAFIATRLNKNIVEKEAQPAVAASESVPASKAQDSKKKNNVPSKVFVGVNATQKHRKIASLDELRTSSGSIYSDVHGRAEADAVGSIANTETTKVSKIEADGMDVRDLLSDPRVTKIASARNAACKKSCDRLKLCSGFGSACRGCDLNKVDLSGFRSTSDKFIKCLDADKDLRECTQRISCDEYLSWWNREGVIPCQKEEKVKADTCGNLAKLIKK